MTNEAWCSRLLAVTLSADEADVFLAAAAVLLPEHLRADLVARSDSDELRDALCALWQRTGRAAHAPAVMPETPLAPGVVGAFLQLVFARVAPEKRGQ